MSNKANGNEEKDIQGKPEGEETKDPKTQGTNSKDAPVKKEHFWNKTWFKITAGAAGGFGLKCLIDTFFGGESDDDDEESGEE